MSFERNAKVAMSRSSAPRSYVIGPVHTHSIAWFDAGSSSCSLESAARLLSRTAASSSASSAA